jgi:DNA-binding FadR family transcriptional regulator
MMVIPTTVSPEIAMRTLIMQGALPFDKLQKTTLYDEATQQIKRAILGGKYKPGDPLPAERELAEALGVGRPTIREALKTLRDRGLIVLDPTARRYVVKTPDLENCVLQIQEQISWLIQVTENTISDFWAVIPHLMGMTAHAAVGVMTDDGLRRLESTLEQIEGSGQDFSASCRAAYRFGLDLAEMTGNRLIILLWKMFDKVIQEEFPPILSVMEPKGPRNLVAYHRGVLEALRARDPDAIYRAVAARIRYLKNREARISG